MEFIIVSAVLGAWPHAKQSQNGPQMLFLTSGFTKLFGDCTFKNRYCFLSATDDTWPFIKGGQCIA